MDRYAIVDAPDYILPRSATLNLCGPSQSGKTTFLLCLLREADKVFQEPFKRIFFSYSEDQHMYEEIKQLFPETVFHKGIPDLQTLEEFCSSVEGYSLLIFDDLQTSMDTQEVSELFLRVAHHKCTYIINLQQAIFRAGYNARLQSINSSHFCLTKSNRDRLMIKRFFSQLAPTQSSKLLAVYDDMMETENSSPAPPHMWINCHSFDNTVNNRFMTNVVCSPYRIVYKII